MILILSMLALLPWPPGGKAVFAVPIILMSLELAFQRDAIWLPRWALNASISRPAYRAGVSRIMKMVRYVENLTRPRIPFLTGEIADTVTGLVCVVLALIMALPIPFGDALPGIALVFFALGMMQRDGVAILLGAVASGACGPLSVPDLENGDRGRPPCGKLDGADIPLSGQCKRAAGSLQRPFIA